MFYACYFAGEFTHTFADYDEKAMLVMRKDINNPENDIRDYIPVWDDGNVYRTVSEDTAAQIERFGRVVYSGEIGITDKQKNAAHILADYAPYVLTKGGLVDQNILYTLELAIQALKGE